MDLDEIFPTTKADGPALGDQLSELSVAELEERIAALKSEIARVEAEIGTRKKCAICRRRRVQDVISVQHEQTFVVKWHVINTMLGMWIYLCDIQSSGSAGRRGPPCLTPPC